jgi:hypothetical protein
VAGRDRVALHRCVGLDRLGRVDADVADVLGVALVLDLDRVAVDDAGDLHGGLVGHGLGALVRVAAGHE